MRRSSLFVSFDTFFIPSNKKSGYLMLSLAIKNSQSKLRRADNQWAAKNAIKFQQKL